MNQVAACESESRLTFGGMKCLLPTHRVHPDAQSMYGVRLLRHGTVSFKFLAFDAVAQGFQRVLV